MRILITTQNYYPAFSFGGRAVKSTALAEGLVRLGHDVTVVTSNVIERGMRPGLRGHTSTIRGVKVHYLGTLVQYRAISLNPGVLPFAYSQVGNFDVVHIIGLYDLIGPAIAYYSRMKGVPYVIEPSGMLIPIVRSLVLKRLYHALLGHSIMANAAAVIATSAQEKEDFIKFGIESRRIFERRNGVDLSEYQRPIAPQKLQEIVGLTSDARVILYLGRIDRKKEHRPHFPHLFGLLTKCESIPHLVLCSWQNSDMLCEHPVCQKSSETIRAGVERDPGRDLPQEPAAASAGGRHGLEVDSLLDIGENRLKNTKNWPFVDRLKACEKDQGSAPV